MGTFLNDLFCSDPARKMVAYAQKKRDRGNPMCYFVILNGIGAGYLGDPSTGKHNYKVIIDEIHNLQVKKPKKSVKEGYEYALFTTIKVIDGIKSLYMVLDYLDYEGLKRRDGTGTFRINYRGLMDALKEKINEKRDKLIEMKPDFDSWLQKRLDVIEENLGEK